MISFRILTGGLLLTASLMGQTPPHQPVDESMLFIPPGFDHMGQPRYATEDTAGQLRIVVRDAATGQLIPCRANVVGSDGNFYQPPTNVLSPFALTHAWPVGVYGNRPGRGPYRYIGHFFYLAGEMTLSVVPGRTRVEIWKGFEYRPEVATVEVKPRTSQTVEVRLTHSIPMDAAGYYPGDSHVHFPRGTEAQDQTIFDLLSAEGVQYAVTLAYNATKDYSGNMADQGCQQPTLGRASIRRSGAETIMSGQEYRCKYGHYMFGLRDDLVYAGKKLNIDLAPAAGETARMVRQAGGVAILAHGGEFSVWADAALGSVNALELLQMGIYRGPGLQGWYQILNSGYRFPVVGASDYGACRTLADCRTYVYAGPASSSSRSSALGLTHAIPSMQEWLGGLGAGRSFVTSAPILLLDVDGEKPGGQLRKTGSGPFTVKVSVRARCEVTPITDVDLIVNGRVVEHRTVSEAERQGHWVEFSRSVELTSSSWVAARAYSIAPVGLPDAEALTNPVYVYLNNRAPYDPAALDAWIRQVDAEIKREEARSFPGKAEVVAYFRSAREVLVKIRARGGLTADEDPTALATGSK